MINDIAGYTEKYYSEMMDQISHEELILKYRKEKVKFDHKQSGTLLADDHPHVLMVLESVQDLIRMPGPKVGNSNLA